MTEQCNPKPEPTGSEERDRKAKWRATDPYPDWPFGVVSVRQLAKWSKQNSQPTNMAEALM